MDLCFGEQNRIILLPSGRGQCCWRTKGESILFPRYRSPGHIFSRAISLFSVLQRGGHQGEMDFWVPPSTRLLFTVTDAENKTQTQAEGLETKPMEQMESNSLTDDTAIPTQLGTYLKARWRLMESFEKHFICLETIWVWHCFCFPSHPKCFWTTP